MQQKDGTPSPSTQYFPNFLFIIIFRGNFENLASQARRDADCQLSFFNLLIIIIELKLSAVEAAPLSQGREWGEGIGGCKKSDRWRSSREESNCQLSGSLGSLNKILLISSTGGKISQGDGLEEGAERCQT
jgi:hypothetical protein